MARRLRGAGLGRTVNFFAKIELVQSFKPRGGGLRAERRGRGAPECFLGLSFVVRKVTAPLDRLLPHPWLCGGAPFAPSEIRLILELLLSSRG